MSVKDPYPLGFTVDDGGNVHDLAQTNGSPLRAHPNKDNREALREKMVNVLVPEVEFDRHWSSGHIQNVRHHREICGDIADDLLSAMDEYIEGALPSKAYHGKDCDVDEYSKQQDLCSCGATSLNQALRQFKENL